MSIATLFRIATNWKQPKCPPADEWEHRTEELIQNAVQKDKEIKYF